jgi:NADPH:quinone reductase-like Zn-dependent oxidoreductase
LLAGNGDERLHRFVAERRFNVGGAEDFTKRGEIYDVIFDVVGTISFSRTEKSIKQNGTYLLANPRKQMVQGLWTKMTSSKKNNYGDIKPKD